MAFEWFRSWHGAPTDSKWLVIDRRSHAEGVTPGMVSAVAWALMDYASQHADRGSVEGFDVETYVAWSGWHEDQIKAIITAMQDKGLITNDNRLASWEKRQPKKEDPGAADRMRKMRDAKRNADVTRYESVTDESVTNGYDVLHDVTLDKIREDENRGETAADFSTVQSRMIDQWRVVLGNTLTPAIFPEVRPYMVKLHERGLDDWWIMALQETTGARRPGWQYMKAILEGWLAAGKPSTYTNGKTTGDADTRPRVKAMPADVVAAADARQAAYEQQIAEELARAGRLVA